MIWWKDHSVGEKDPHWGNEGKLSELVVIIGTSVASLNQIANGITNKININSYSGISRIVEIPGHFYSKLVATIAILP